MGKVNINDLTFFEDEYETYEKFTKSNRKKTRNEEDILQSQGKSGRGRKGDSHITQRTKARN
jgi:hypothetical protein